MSTNINGVLIKTREYRATEDFIFTVNLLCKF